MGTPMPTKAFASQQLLPGDPTLLVLWTNPEDDFHLAGQLEAALGCMLLWGVLSYSSRMWLSPLWPQQKEGERGTGLVDLS